MLIKMPDDIKLEFKKPEIEPRFQAQIYVTLQEEKEVYRLLVGREGTEVPKVVGDFVGYHEISGYMDGKGIEAWIKEQVELLEAEGKSVEYDESLSYLVARAVDELASESKCLEGECLIIEKPKGGFSDSFFEGLRRFQYGETAEESDQGFEQMRQAGKKKADSESECSEGE